MKYKHMFLYIQNNSAYGGLSICVGAEPSKEGVIMLHGLSLGEPVPRMDPDE